MDFQQNGYIMVPQAITYNEWRGYALTHGVNVDFCWGNQCWDLCALLWYQYGLRLATGPGHHAYECWTNSRDFNARTPFTKVYRIEDVKRGDVIVFNHHGSYTDGHICFADEDYNGGGRLNCLGQNQGQGNGYGKSANIVRFNVYHFIGAFRNTKWEHTQPDPGPTPSPKKQKRFPWVLYSRKLRGER